MSRRHILIGDIHACHEELCELLDRVALSEGDVLVSLGDVVDRGPAPAEVLALLRGRPNTVVLMGNHERKHARQVFSFSQEVTRLQLGEGYAEAVRWMTGLPYVYEADTFLATHAAWMPGKVRGEQREDVLSGTVSGERALTEALGSARWAERYDGDKPLVVGHHVVSAPEIVRDRVYFLDTGACHGGALTALIVPDFKLVSVPARTDHWSQVRRAWQSRVLLTRPWPEMSWSKARRELDRLSEGPDPSLTAVAAWMDAVEGLFPECLTRLLRHEADPATVSSGMAPLLHMARRGRLDLTTLRERHATPRQLLTLADALGVERPPSTPM